VGAGIYLGATSSNISPYSFIKAEGGSGIVGYFVVWWRDLLMYRVSIGAVQKGGELQIATINLTSAVHITPSLFLLKVGVVVLLVIAYFFTSPS